MEYNNVQIRKIDKLVDLKKEIANSNFALKDKEEQTVLEKRYLCFNIHRNALGKISIPIKSM